MKKTSSVTTLIGRSPRSLRTLPLPFLATAFAEYLLAACLPVSQYGTADPFSCEGLVPSTLFFPSIYATVEHPTRAGGYEGYSDIATLDIFVFNDDGVRRLDSYSRIDRPETPYITVTSSAGDKLVVVVANCGSKSFDASDFWSYDSLEEVRWDYADEDPQHPVMSGECQLCAGASVYTPVQLTPLMANVCLDFIKCDFAGRGYSSKTLSNACVYLTNISGSAEILRQDGFRPSQIENYGSLDRAFLSTMSHPEALYSTVRPGQWSPIDLYCYPNDSSDGALGSPRTRLVVQGDIDSQTYYYPIDINQEGFGYTSGPHGVSRNIRYSYSLLITRKGSTDPDTPVGPEQVVEEGWIKLYPGQFITGTDGEQIHIWCELYPEDTPLDICKDDLDYDVGRGIYTYEMDADGKGVVLTLVGNGTGMFTIDAGPPVNDGFLIVVVVNP